jgi:hypothetical protein
MKGRMMLAGPSGAGKTYTALTIAATLGTSTLVLDTEKESALTYADTFAFDHLRWEPPFDPRELASVLTEADGYDTIVVDSLSHFWQKQGGTLEIADGKFTGWGVARPAQELMVEAILTCRAHVIVCVRSKQKFTQQQDDRGKHVVIKLGVGTIQDDTLDYEMNVAAELDLDHNLTVSKSRTEALPVGRTYRPGDVSEMAAAYSAWLASGDSGVATVPVKRAKAELLEATGGDADAARAAWGDRHHVTRAELDDLIAGAS